MDWFGNRHIMEFAKKMKGIWLQSLVIVMWTLGDVDLHIPRERLRGFGLPY